MKSNEYIKRYGINQAKKAVSECTYGYGIDLIELKRIVESHELVEQYNGLFEEKELIRVSPKLTSELRGLVAAIADVESCL